MKLFKKVLAAALAGVLALSVLTGCNNSAATVTMVDALNDWSKVYGEGITFEKGDEALQAQVNALVEIVDEAGKKIDFKDAKDFEDVYNTFMENDAAKLKLGAWADSLRKQTLVMVRRCMSMALPILAQLCLQAAVKTFTMQSS